jgi:beta-glucosidase
VSLNLPGNQGELVRAIHRTGTPVVVVLINGRPLTINWTAENVPAVVEAWFPGQEGGNAVAELLFGKINPSGKLTMTFPKSVGQIPLHYNHYPQKNWDHEKYGERYVDIEDEPLFPFGYGLSYTKFDYGNLKIIPSKTDKKGEIRISLDVKNVGKIRGDETVQLYLNDVVSSVTTPSKELKGFKKVTLNPGEKKNVEFTLTPNELSLVDRNMEWVVEPGIFEVMIGSSSEDIRLKGSFEIIE